VGGVTQIKEDVCGASSQFLGRFYEDAKAMNGGLEKWLERLEAKIDKHHANREREAGALTTQVNENTSDIKRNAKDIHAMHDWKRKVDRTSETVSTWLWGSELQSYSPYGFRNMIRIKPGTRVFGIRPEMVIAIMIAEGVWGLQDAELVLTSVIEGHHMYKSKHYDGSAIDARSKNLADAPKAVLELKTRLGVDYDVILEDKGKPNEHIHMQFVPKMPYG